MAQRTIDLHRACWERKSALRAVYSDYHRRLATACVQGPTLEIGGGSGHLKAFMTDIVSIDIQEAPWLDAVADAHALPLADGSVANVVLLDVVHHLAHPIAFLREAARILRPGGRVLLIEPAMTPLARFFLTHFHEEDVVMSADPFSAEPQTDNRPESANQAVPHLIFEVYGGRLAEAVPELSLTAKTYLSLWAYPLCGGFQPWSLIPGWAVPPLLWVEDRLMPLLGSLAAIRLMVVLERRA